MIHLMKIQAHVESIARGYELHWYVDSPDQIRVDVYRVSDPTCISQEGVLLGTRTWTAQTGQDSEAFIVVVAIDGRAFGSEVMQKHQRSVLLSKTLQQVLN